MPYFYLMAKNLKGWIWIVVTGDDADGWRMTLRLIFYNVQVQLMNTYENKIYDHNFIIEDFREKIKILEIGPFRKMAKTFFSIKDIN